MQDVPKKKQKLKHFSDDKKKEILKYGLQQNSWKVAANKYGVTAKKVGMWAKNAGKKLKFFYKTVDQKMQRKILHYGIQENSWSQAARKFAVPLTAVKSWAKKAGYKLTFLKNKTGIKCSVCQIPLEGIETMDDHISVFHLTVDQSCNVCGYNSEDVVNHFYDHITK